MGRTSASAHDRAQQYASHGLYATDSKTVFCRFCNCRIGWEKKDNIEKHIKSEKHSAQRQQNAAASQKRQSSIVECLSGAKRRKQEKDTFGKRTVEAFVKANIPLEKLENDALRSWISEFSTEDLPCGKTLREKYLPEIASDHKQHTSEALVGRKINILCDETTDRMGRCVFIVLFQMPDLEERKLFPAAVRFLESANATNCSRVLLETLREHKVPYEAVQAFVSDSAPYMTLCYQTLKVVIGDHLLHVQCWAHKLSLVGKCWTTVMSDLNTVVTMVKSAFLNTRKRKYKYMQFLKSNTAGLKEAKLFPIPVVTRWNSWFEAVFYLANYFHDVVSFFQLPEMQDTSNSGVNYIKNLTKKDVNKIHTHMIFVKDHTRQLVDLLTLLEGSKYPTSHILYPKLKNLELNFAEICKGQFSLSTKNALQNLTILEQAACKDVFFKAANAAKSKLETLRSRDPNRMGFEALAQAFYPRNVILNSAKDAQIETLLRFPTEAMQMISGSYECFRKLVVKEVNERNRVDVINVFRAMRTESEHETFAKHCLDLLWTPTNNVDSERLLSHYNTVVTDRRCNLKESSAEICTLLSFE